MFLKKNNKKKILDSYNKNGFVKINKILTNSQINSIKEDINIQIEKTLKVKKTDKRAFHLTMNNKINSMHGLDNLVSVKNLQKSKKVLDIVRLLIGNKIDNFGSELFAKPAGYGMSVPIHQDNKYWCLTDSKALTVWFALERSDETNGAIFYFKGSHKLGLLEHTSSFAPGSSQKIRYESGLNLFNRSMPILEKGDCLFHNCLVAHGSKKNISKKSRTGLTLRFKNKATKVDEIQRKMYENQLNKQLKK